MELKKYITFIAIIIIVAYTNLGYKNFSNTDKIPLNAKISQMIVIGFNGSESSVDNLKNDIENGNISGVIFYKRNIKNPNDFKNLTDELNNLSKNNNYPLFMMLDQEGGLVSRIATDNGFKNYPSAKNIASKYTLNDTYNLYYDMASNLKNIGINFNLAPCVDVKTNDKSSIDSHFRIYSSNPDTVFKYSNEFIKAHNEAKVITALKHFPGLGNAQFDTHKVLPDITNSWKPSELIPFEKLLSKYPKEPVLIGHVINKNIDSDFISSLSEKNNLNFTQ